MKKQIIICDNCKTELKENQIAIITDIKISHRTFNVEGDSIHSETCSWKCFIEWLKKKVPHWTLDVEIIQNL